MAHWMKHWPALVAVGWGLVALWLLPPDPPRRIQGYTAPTQAQALRVELMAEARRLNNVLKRTRWLDSLSDVLANSEPDESGAILSFPEGLDVDDETVITLRTHVAGEIDLLGIESAAYSFAAAWPNARSGNHEAFSKSRATFKEFFAFEAEDRKVCLALYPARSNILGPCAYYLIHGTPGPRIGAWLSSGGAKFGTWYAESRNPFADPRLSSLEKLFQKVGNRAPFGIRQIRLAGNQTHACLAGDEEACRNSVLDPERPRQAAFGTDVPAFVHSEFSQGSFYTFEESLFYDLEQEFGREAFGHFWTSDQDVETAFKAAFGLPIGKWVMGWAQDRLGVYRMGPMPSLEAILISLGVISFFLTIAIAMGVRRRVA
ncbi:MAG: hypothetical protein BMS9Abin29_0702 [Gemmatimonadota bacterium]|nr:MAG: hypothetical protein BMS9Abin29_0702 [Gemmatimonadota bacterium]